jgi:hypothetical protein
MRLLDRFKKKPNTQATPEPNGVRPEQLRDLPTGEHEIGKLILSWSCDTNAGPGEFSEPYLDEDGKPIPGATCRWSRLVIPMVARWPPKRWVVGLREVAENSKVVFRDEQTAEVVTVGDVKAEAMRWAGPATLAEKQRLSGLGSNDASKMRRGYELDAAGIEAARGR